MAAGIPTTQNPTPIRISAVRQSVVAMSHITTGTNSPPSAEPAEVSANARVRKATNQFATAIVTTIHVPSDMPSVINANAE